MKLFCVKHNRKEPDESFCCPECEAEALAEIEAEEAEWARVWASRKRFEEEQMLEDERTQYGEG